MFKSNFFSKDLKNLKRIFVLDAPSKERDQLVQFLELKEFELVVHDKPSSLFNDERLGDSVLSVLLINIDISKLRGSQLTELVSHNQIEIPIICFGQVASVSQGIAAVKQGALDFLVQPINQTLLLKAIDAGINASEKIKLNNEAQQTLKNRLSVLSPREQEVFNLLIKGYSNAELVSSLGISLDTVKQYKTSLMRKLEAKSLSQLMSMVPFNQARQPWIQSAQGAM